MDAVKLLVKISRQFLKDKKVNKYHMKKVDEMTEEEVVSVCHWYCEENKLTEEWQAYREKEEAKYCYCNYLEEYIDESLCYDLQMVAYGTVKPSVLPNMIISKEKCSACCSDCKHSL